MLVAPRAGNPDTWAENDIFRLLSAGRLSSTEWIQLDWDSAFPLTAPRCVYCVQRLTLNYEVAVKRGTPALTYSVAAQTFGQEDDMTVLTLQLVPPSLFRIGEAHA